MHIHNFTVDSGDAILKVILPLPRKYSPLDQSLPRMILFLMHHHINVNNTFEIASVAKQVCKIALNRAILQTYLRIVLKMESVIAHASLNETYL